MSTKFKKKYYLFSYKILWNSNFNVKKDNNWSYFIFKTNLFSPSDPTHKIEWQIIIVFTSIAISKWLVIYISFNSNYFYTSVENLFHFLATYNILFVSLICFKMCFYIVAFEVDKCWSFIFVSFWIILKTIIAYYIVISCFDCFLKINYIFTYIKEYYLHIKESNMECIVHKNFWAA